MYCRYKQKITFDKRQELIITIKYKKKNTTCYIQFLEAFHIYSIYIKF